MPDKLIRKKFECQQFSLIGALNSYQTSFNQRHVSYQLVTAFYQSITCQLLALHCHLPVTNQLFVSHLSITRQSFTTLMVSHFPVTARSLPVTSQSLACHQSVTCLSLVSHLTITSQSLVNYQSVTCQFLVSHMSVTCQSVFSCCAATCHLLYSSLYIKCVNQRKCSNIGCLYLIYHEETICILFHLIPEYIIT